MLFPVLFALLQGSAPSVAAVRVDTAITIDGRLDEPAWTRAARLGDFRQYEPVDGRPAEERTEVRVFYSARALHFGIVAYARDPSSIRATLADRDNIESDDRITIYLDTFNDRRRAFLFGVNALGVQLDGVRTEGAVSAGRIFGGNIDLSPDYLFESRGRVTDSGYVVEVRIPFRSLRFPAGSGPQSWGLNIVRSNAATGYNDTWTDVRRANTSFLAQAGVLTGIANVERGVVTEIQPFVTSGWRGDVVPATGRFERADPTLDAGANLRFGFPAFSLDATVNPDFSQVESDAGLIAVNERFALFIPEKRTFFLEGIELFNTPSQLVYSRRIVSPLAGAKVTGKLGAHSIAYLSAVDERRGADALFNIARIKRDIGTSSAAGFTFTDRRLAGAYNTVVSGDVRWVFRRLYYIEPQLAWSFTDRGDAAGRRRDPLWKLEFDRTGRAWGFNYRVDAIGARFQSDAGFVPRTGFVRGAAFNRFSLYGRPGAPIENFTVFLGPSRIWNYEGLVRQGPVEGSDFMGGITTLRGGWSVNWGIYRQLVVFDQRLFAGLTVRDGSGLLVPYVAPRGLDGLWGDSVGVRSPVFQRFTAGVGAARHAIPIYLEGSEGREVRASGFLALRPTPGIRLESRAVVTRIERARDGSEFARAFIPRLRADYQPTRALFFRLIGEWRAERRAPLQHAVTGAPLYLGGVRTPVSETGSLRTDWLASYEPTPGTVAFFGYGSTAQPTTGSRFADRERVADGFFVKLAYQLRR